MTTTMHMDMSTSMTMNTVMGMSMATIIMPTIMQTAAATIMNTSTAMITMATIMNTNTAMTTMATIMETAVAAATTMVRRIRRPVRIHILSQSTITPRAIPTTVRSAIPMWNTATYAASPWQDAVA